jgi:Rieske Fe-S protein
VAKEGFDFSRRLLLDRLVKRDRLPPPGSGAVMADGLGQVAVYRDPAGGRHTMSARCTHLGCIVSWNDADKSWDCPCHGSRFSPLGKVIEGPAVSDLAPER